MILVVNIVKGSLEEETLNSKTKSTDNANNLSKKLPSAIIIGAKKCGTRALLKFIGAHPNVSTAGAEVHFFDRFYHMGLDWYRDQMPLSNDHQITMEKTPKYLIDDHVPERVHNMNPNTKIIVVLRNPVVRAVSEYVQSQWRKKRKALQSEESNDSIETKNFEKMLYKKNTREIQIDWSVVRNGLYVKYIKKWSEYFPIEQILFVNGEQLIKEPHIEIDKLQRFLNLKPVIKKEHFVHDKRKGFACIIKPIDSKQVKCLNEQKGRTHPNLSSEILQDLEEYYRPFNRELFKLINQEPWWPV
jgi:hypothetical protein